ncbi:MAG: class I SAM-dependent methyltransferase [Candidatus Marinimicrobia bacterium]|nr:class I SAM-dependent methyltransferase [Candidatus Neomarinimicrobiota bacterium]
MLKLISEEINQYCESHSQGDSELLKELTAYTYETEDIPQMVSGMQVGNVLQGFIKSIQAKKVIEVGMFTGYSALKMAEALPEDGQVHTCELMTKHVNTAQSFFDRSPHGHKVHIHEGKAADSLEQLKSGQFDLAFIDADKGGYQEYYLKCMSLLRSGGIIVLDNMLWSGQVLDPQDDDTLALRNTAEFIDKDNRVFNYLLPVRDGLMVCIKN